MRTRRLLVTAMLSAASFVLMAAVQVPILPYAPYLTYDPSDVVALLAGLVYGPGTGVAVVALKDVLFLFLRAHGPIGPVADFLAAATFVAVTAQVFRMLRGPFARRLVYAAAAGTVARVLVMVPANFALLALQFGMSPHRIAAMLLPVIVPFNAVKAAANAAITVAVAEPITRAIGARAAGR